MSSNHENPSKTLQRMWAPWRLEYILQPENEGCFLCEAFAGSNDRQNLVIHRGLRCAVILNRYPYNNGHLLIAPYRHTSSLAELDSEDRLELMNLAATSVEILTRQINAQGINAGLNLGDVAGAGLKDHIHMHVVPRWCGDTNFMPVLADTKVMPQYLDSMWEMLQGAYQDA